MSVMNGVDLCDGVLCRAYDVGTSKKVNTIKRSRRLLPYCSLLAHSLPPQSGFILRKRSPGSLFVKSLTLF